MAPEPRRIAAETKKTKAAPAGSKSGVAAFASAETLTISPATNFYSVSYINPFAPAPIGSSEAGVIASLNPSGVTAGYVAYAQLLENNVPVGYGTGSSASSVRVLNVFPLAPGPSYILQVQFAAKGQNPQDLDWSNPANVISAAVLTQQANVRTLSVVNGSPNDTVNFTWDIPSGGQVGGVYLQVINATSGALTGNYYLGSDANGTVSMAFGSGTDYAVRVSAIQPIVANTNGGFAAPYSIGAPTSPQPVPTGAPAITSVTYDGSRVSVDWTAPALPAGEAITSLRYELLLMSGAAVVTSIPAGAAGGQAVIGNLDAIANPGIAARLSYDICGGPIGSALALVTAEPDLISVSMTESGGTVSLSATYASPVALSASCVLNAVLSVNGQETSASAQSSPATVSWTGITPAANTSYEIAASITNTVNAQASEGPQSPRLALPLTAPVVSGAGYDGEILTIGVDFNPGMTVDGYLVTIAGTSALSFKAGPSLPIAMPQTLDLSGTYTVAVQPLIGPVTGLVSSQAAIGLPAIAAPALTLAAYDGALLSLKWNAAVLPYLTGYQVTITPSGQNAITLATGPETECVVPLSPGLAAGATVSVKGVSRLRNTAGSTAVSLLTDAVAMGAITVSSSSVAAAWSVTGTPSVLAELLIDDTVVAVPAGATQSGVTFATPADKTQPYALRARIVSSDGVAMGPPSAAAALLLNAPVLNVVQIGQSTMDLAWSLAGPFQPTHFTLTATPTSGSAASVVTTEAVYSGPAPQAFMQAGTLQIAASNAFCTGPAGSATNYGQPTLGAASYDGATLTVAVSAGGGASGNVYWFDVLADGAVIARKVITPASGTPATPVAIPVGIPEGSNAVMQLSGVSPGSIAPACAPASIPSAVPTLLSAAYDGSTLHVRWDAVPGPGVDGYVVSVAGGNPAIPNTNVTGGDSAYIAIDVGSSLSYPFGSGVKVTISAASGIGGNAIVTGEPSAAAVPELTGYDYGVGVVAAGDPPYLFRSGTYQTLSDVSGLAITLYLPTPFNSGDTPTVPSGSGNIFQLAPAPEGSSLPYQFTMSTDVWTTLGSSGVRADLRTAYNTFLGAVEDEGVYAWAIPLLRQVIAEAMPQTFEEVVFYRYGLWRDNSIRVADLTPGTRLQVSNALYQSIVGGSSEKNGYLALGTEIMDLNSVIPQGGGGTLASGAGRSLSVDTFLSLLYPGGGTANNGRPVAAGAIDFFNDNNRQAYYRLFYPASFFPSGSNGSTALTGNVALIGATSWKTLTSITDQYATTGVFPSTTDYFATYFRGRSAITPLLNVNIAAESRWVPLGTTVRQLLAAQGLAPCFGGEGGEVVAMTRASANLFTYPVATAGLALDPVDLTNASLGGVAPLYWPLDMPVVGGDQIELSRSSRRR